MVPEAVQHRGLVARELVDPLLMLLGQRQQRRLAGQLGDEQAQHLLETIWRERLLPVPVPLDRRTHRGPGVAQVVLVQDQRARHVGGIERRRQDHVRERDDMSRTSLPRVRAMTGQVTLQHMPAVARLRHRVTHRTRRLPRLGLEPPAGVVSFHPAALDLDDAGPDARPRHDEVRFVLAVLLHQPHRVQQRGVVRQLVAQCLPDGALAVSPVEPLR